MQESETLGSFYVPWSSFNGYVYGYATRDRFLTATVRAVTKGVIHAVDGLALKAEADVGVDVGGDGDVSVTE